MSYFLRTLANCSRSDPGRQRRDRRSASTQFTAGTIQFEAPAAGDGGAFDLESGAFNLRVDGPTETAAWQ